MIKTDCKINEQEVSYEIEKDGYIIYLGSKPWISQYEPYIPHPDWGYEKSCLKQIDELINSAAEQKNLVDRLAIVEASQSVQDGAITDLASLIGGA